MKKLNTIKYITATALAALTAFTATGCGFLLGVSSQSDKQPVMVTATFDYNYEGAPESYVQEVERNDVPTPPEDPTREDYAFTGWYMEESCATEVDFEVVLLEDTTFYAGWVMENVNITFSYNYTGAPTAEVVKVKPGELIQTPATPQREGWLFQAWYTDSACTAGKEYDFSVAASADMKLYAKWIKNDGSVQLVTVTYMWNYDGAPDDGIAAVNTFEANSKTKAHAVARENQYFDGWYTEAECTTPFDFNSRINSDVTLYAKWYNILSFEAEYIDLSGIAGSGYSGNQSGVNIIERDDKEAGASNGYYVGWLYQNGITLTFNVYSEEAVTDAYLALSLTAETKSFSLNCNDFLVKVNDRQVFFYDLEFENIPSVSSPTLKPFRDYVLNKVSLNAGNNTIQLIINNSNKMFDSGTMYAHAPLVDCVRLYTNSNVTWAEGFPMTDNTIGK